jgi:hypothetical protein
MKKSKEIHKIIALLIVAAFCLPFVFACGEKEEDATPTQSNDNITAGSDAIQEQQTDPPATEEKPTEPPEPDSGSVKLLNKDFETKGDWVGNYGSEGSIIYTSDNSSENLPAYAKVEFSGPDGDPPQEYTWWDSDSGNSPASDDEEMAAAREASALFKTADKTSRIAACWYDEAFFTVNISIGETPKKVTLYMNDYDQYNRAAEIKVKNKNGKTMQEPPEVVIFEADDYSGGCYLSYLISGEVQFMLDCFSGNVVLSGIFFDPAP